jgi:hypothetical protein
MTDIPRGKYMGRRLGDPPASEAEHFVQCLPEHAILGTVVDGLTDLELAGPAQPPRLSGSFISRGLPRFRCARMLSCRKKASWDFDVLIDGI